MGTIEDKKELGTLLNIVINQIPSYTNMVNSEHWDVSLDDCIFGMVYNSFVTKATDYLNNNLIDTEQETDVESTLQMMNLISEVFNDRLADVKQEIISALNS